jgi:hypothetical protein
MNTSKVAKMKTSNGLGLLSIDIWRHAMKIMKKMSTNTSKKLADEKKKQLCSKKNLERKSNNCNPFLSTFVPIMFEHLLRFRLRTRRPGFESRKGITFFSKS